MDANEDLEFQKWEQRETQSEAYETECWGCGLRLLLPSQVPVFKCGWCGAISSHHAKAKKSGCCTKFSRALDCVLVATVLVLISLIIGGGSWAVFPVLFPDFTFGFWTHLILTSFLSFNTLFNYCVAAIVQPGPLPEMVWGSYESITKGALEGHRFCHACNKPKPPRVHHCRVCKACVLDMDHHCPFIGNCVGAANHRPFILFLIFTVISNLYVLVMSILAIIELWSAVTITTDMLVVPSTSWHLVMVLVSYLQVMLGSSISASARTITLLYLVAVSLSVAIGVGLLLYQQIQQLQDGYGFIDSLQSENRVLRDVKPGWRNLTRIFGYGHPLFWFLPRSGFVTSGKKTHEK